MKRFKERIQNLHPYAICAVWGPLILAQFVLVFILSQPGSQVLRWAGYLTWCFSAAFGWLPIFVLNRKGRVPKGKSYVHTTELVETGLYAVVRHPQMGTAGILMSLGMILITQHWASLVLGLPAMVLNYMDLLNADQRLIEKFGQAYRDYMQRVPRVNFIAGLFRLARARMSRQP